MADYDEFATAIVSLLGTVQGARQKSEAMSTRLLAGELVGPIEIARLLAYQDNIITAFAMAFEAGMTEVESFDIPDTEVAVFAKDLKVEDAFVLAGQMYEVFAIDRAFQSSKESITLALKHLDLDSNRQLICHVPPDTKIELIARKK